VQTTYSKTVTTHQTAPIFAFAILLANDDFINKLIVYICCTLQIGLQYHDNLHLWL